LRLLENIRHLISKKSQVALQKEINRNVAMLYRLAIDHYDLADNCAAAQWRQKISRYYYAAYCCSRAVRLHHDGVFSTDPADHQQIGKLPDTFPNHATFSNRLKTLREDRNLADYSHDSVEADLILKVSDARDLVTEFMKDAKSLLVRRGLRL